MKPANLILKEDGSGYLLADFGTAIKKNGITENEDTYFVGTFLFMIP